MAAYEFTGETKRLEDGTIVKRIRSFDGLLGGWIEDESNLSKNGNCFVYDEAMVYKGAYVYGDAEICYQAQIYDHSYVSGDALVSGYVIVKDHSKVFDLVNVSDDAVITNASTICGTARIIKNARVSSSCIEYGVIGKDAYINRNSDFMCIKNIGSRLDTATFYHDIYNGISVKIGCFNGTLEEFEKKVKKVHAGTKYEKEYMCAVELAKIHIGCE